MNSLTHSLHRERRRRRSFAVSVSFCVPRPQLSGKEKKWRKRKIEKRNLWTRSREERERERATFWWVMMRLVTDDGRPLEKRSSLSSLSSRSRSGILISLWVGFAIHFSINITHTSERQRTLVQKRAHSSDSCEERERERGEEEEEEVKVKWSEGCALSLHKLSEASSSGFYDKWPLCEKGLQM